MDLIQPLNLPTVTDFDSWKLWVENKFEKPNLENSGINNYLRITGIPDLVIADHISPFFSGFMTAPVAMISEDSAAVVEARSRHTVSVDDIIAELVEESTTNDLYLYTLTYHPRMPMMYMVDSKTLEPIRLKEPDFSKEYWWIRYGVISK